MSAVCTLSGCAHPIKEGSRFTLPQDVERHGAETKAHCKEWRSEWRSVAKVWKDEIAKNGGGGAAKACKLKRTR